MGFWLYWRGWRNLGQWCVVLGIGLVLALSSPLVGDALLGALEDDFAIERASASPSADAIVVLGGVTVPPVPPMVTVEAEAGISRDTGERLLVRLAGMGLVRETTRATRCRLWTAAL